MRIQSPRRFHFTKKALESLPIPTGRLRYFDTKVPALALALTTSGAKSFYLYRRIEGRPEQIWLGSFPNVSIEQARKKAEKLNGEIADGKNPATLRREAHAGMRLGELFETYQRRYAIPPRNAESTRLENERLFKRYFEAWRNREISKIRHRDVVALHADLGKKTPYAANHAITLLRSLYNRARYEWEVPCGNPAEKIRKFREDSRERFLQPDEAPRLFDAVTKERNLDMRDIVLMALFTGARQGNLLGMRWEDLNLERGIWTIPRTKSGKSLQVALSPEAVTILSARLQRREISRLEARQAAAEGRPIPGYRPDPGIFVFPGRYGRGRFKGVARLWAEILKRAEIRELRLHDLRRTLGSWQAMLGSSLLTIGASLGHRDLHSAQIYARVNLDPVRESVEKAVAAIAKAGNFALPPAGEPGGRT